MLVNHHPETPLAIVRHELWCHTERNARDDVEVLELIHEALRTVEQTSPQQPAGWLISKIVKGLDIEVPGGLGLAGTYGIEAIGEIPLDTSSSKAGKWGAISLLGLLVLTYNPETGTKSHEDPRLLKAQLGSIVAKKALERIANESEDQSDQQILAMSLLLHSHAADVSPISTEDVAIELVDLIPSPSQITETDPAVEEIIPSMGAAIGTPCQHLLDPTHPDIAKKLVAMSWIKSGFDFTTQEITGYPVYKDGEEVAIIYDLTVTNNRLQKIAEEVKSSQVQRKFWNLLANSVVKALENRCKLTLHSRVNPTYSIGANARNDNLVRGYYVPLGKTATGVQRFGLIAACRTKKRQADVMKLITDGNKSVEGT